MKEIKELLAITKKLKDKYPEKGFTLDGKLVGDIGEVLVAEKYGLELLPENTPIHDAKEKSTGRLIQIKSSFKKNCYLPGHAVPEFFIGININTDGSFEELFNGPGEYLIEHYVKARNIKLSRDNFYGLSYGVLLKLNKEVPVHLKIKTVI
jgi:hypothetical protein